MNNHYYLRIGGNEVFDDEDITNLRSADPAVQKKAKIHLSERLNETRVRVGTLLKTDNVSFLIGAGSSMSAGGVSITTIPLELEKRLQTRGDSNSGESTSGESTSGESTSGESTSGESTSGESTWLSLFYDTASVLSDKCWDGERRMKALAEDLPNAFIQEESDGEEDKDDDGLTDAVVSNKGEENKQSSIALNLEKYLSWLHTWRSSMTEATSELVLNLHNGDLLTVSRVDVDRLILEIERGLSSLSSLPSAGNEDALIYHRRLIKKTLTRPLNLRRANLFTLNYDTLLEQAADAEGAILVDGFVGTLRRVFRPDSYDLDFYFPAQTTEGRVHRFDRALHLYKLHGSITWHRCEADWENPYGLYATFYDQQRPEDDVLIYPSPLKYGQALGMPYSELFRRFGSAIAQPQSVLFTIGYGYGDEHVNALIRQALVIPSFTLVVVDPAPTSDFLKVLIDSNDERVWIVGGWELGTFEHFVEKLLPDLREEEITTKVMKTYNALANPSKAVRPEQEPSDVE